MGNTLCGKHSSTQVGPELGRENHFHGRSHSFARSSDQYTGAGTNMESQHRTSVVGGGTTLKLVVKLQHPLQRFTMVKGVVNSQALCFSCEHYGNILLAGTSWDILGLVHRLARPRFAKTVAIALGIADQLELPSVQIFGPTLAMLLGKDAGSDGAMELWSSSRFRDL